MALTKSSMATFRYNELVAAYPEMAQVDASLKAEIMKYYEADSSGIIQEFVANAVIPIGILVTTQVSVDPTSHQGIGNGATTSTGKVT